MGNAPATSWWFLWMVADGRWAMGGGILGAFPSVNPNPKMAGKFCVSLYAVVSVVGGCLMLGGHCNCCSMCVSPVCVCV